MSWAQRLAAVTPEATPAPPMVLTFSDVNEDGEETTTVTASSSHELSLPEFTKGLLVLDANAFIKGMDAMVSSADAFVTVPQVIAELKDAASRELLERLPYKVAAIDPSSESLRLVVECAEKTGDFGVLSKTDLRLCALAYDVAAVKGELLPAIDPSSGVQTQSGGGGVQLYTDPVSDHDEEDEEECEENLKEEEEKGDDSEDDWITPENLASQQAKSMGGGSSALTTPFAGGVACVTSDYAMQNVLLHLGVPVIGTSGMMVSELRLWLLRCTSCFAVVSDTSRQFCPKCGSGDTLRRVQYVLNKDGEKKLYINFKRKLNTRGTIYNLPKPRGGKHGTNRLLVLREDQLAHVIRGASAASLKAKQVMRNTDGDANNLDLFGAPPKQKKRDLAAPRVTSSYHNYNVNEKKKVRAARRK